MPLKTTARARALAIAAALAVTAALIIIGIAETRHVDDMPDTYQPPLTQPVIEPDRPDLLGEPRIDDDP